MIEVEGYKAFHGTMQITPKNGVAPFEITADWLYKSATDCWYGGGRSFPTCVCKIIQED